MWGLRLAVACSFVAALGSLGGASDVPLNCEGEEWEIDMEDEFGDGWSGNKLDILDCAQSLIIGGLKSVSDSKFETVGFCVPTLTGYIIKVGGGESKYDSDIHWTLRNKRTSEVISTGGSPFFQKINCSSSCGADQENWSVLLASDNRTSWTGAELQITTCDGTVLSSGVTAASKEVEGVDVCVPAGTTGVVVNVVGGQFDNGASWYLRNATSDVVLAGVVPTRQTVHCPDDVCTVWHLTLRDRFDGWNNNFLAIQDCSGQNLHLTTLVSDKLKEETICLPPNIGYTISLGGGWEQNEISFEIAAQGADSSNIVAVSTAPFFGQVNCGLDCALPNKWNIGFSSPLHSEPATISVMSCDGTPLVQNIVVDPGATGQATICFGEVEGVYVRAVGGGDPNQIRWSLRDQVFTTILAGPVPHSAYHACPESPCPADWVAQLRDDRESGWRNARLRLYTCSHVLAHEFQSQDRMFDELVLRECSDPLPGFIVSVDDDLFAEDLSWTLGGPDGIALSGSAPHYSAHNCPVDRCGADQHDWFITFNTRDKAVWGDTTVSLVTCGGVVLVTTRPGAGSLSHVRACVNTDQVRVVISSTTAHTDDPSALRWTLWEWKADRAVVLTSGGLDDTQAFGCPEPCNGALYPIELSSSVSADVFFTVSSCDDNIVHHSLPLLAGHGAHGLHICVPNSGNFRLAIGGSVESNVVWSMRDTKGAVVGGGGMPFFNSYGCPKPACESPLWRLVTTTTFGDGWSNNTMRVMSCDGADVLDEFTMHAEAQKRHAQGFYLCLGESHDGGLRVNVDGGNFQSDILWAVTVPTGAVFMHGKAPFDGAVGCQETCNNNSWVIELTDRGGDGWGQNGLTITSCDFNDVVLPRVSLEAGMNQSLTLCVPSRNGYAVMVGGGAFQDEISWRFEGTQESDGTQLDGGAPFFHSVNCTGCHPFTIPPSTKRRGTAHLPHLGGSCSIDNSLFTTLVEGNILTLIRTDGRVGWAEPQMVTCCFDTQPCKGVRRAAYLIDDFQNGWTNTFMTIRSCSGELLASNITLTSAADQAGVELCLPETSGFIVTVDGGETHMGISWFILEGDTVLVFGRGLTSRQFKCPVNVLRTLPPDERVFEFAPALFGRELGSEAITGQLVDVGDGCEPFDLPKNINAIALVDRTRDGCDFTTKARYATQAGAVMMILVDTTTTLISMGPPGEPSLLPSISISAPTGEELRELIDNQKVVRVSYGTESPSMCQFIHLGTSKLSRKSYNTPFKHPACLIVNQYDPITQFRLDIADVQSSTVTVQRMDQDSGWGTLMLMMCCGAEAPVSPTRSLTSTPSMSPTTTASQTATPSQSLDDGKSTRPNTGAAWHILVPVLAVAATAGILCAVFTHRAMNSRRHRGAQRLMDEDTKVYAAAHATSVSRSSLVQGERRTLL